MRSPYAFDTNYRYCVGCVRVCQCITATIGRGKCQLISSYNSSERTAQSAISAKPGRILGQISICTTVSAGALTGKVLSSHLLSSHITYTNIVKAHSLFSLQLYLLSSRVSVPMYSNVTFTICVLASHFQLCASASASRVVFSYMVNFRL